MREQIKNYLQMKYGFVDNDLFENAYKSLEKSPNFKNLDIQTIYNNIDSRMVENRPIASNLLANVAINYIFNKNHPEHFYQSGVNPKSAYALLPDYDKLMNYLLKVPREELFKKMLITQFNLYDFDSSFNGDINLKNQLDFEVLKKLNQDGDINLKDLQLDLYNDNQILIKNLLLNNDKLILQSNSVAIEKNNDVQSTLYFYTYAYLNGLLTRALAKNGKDIKGFSLINNNGNKEFSVKNFPLIIPSPYLIKGTGNTIREMNISKTPTSHNSIFINQSFYKEINEIYKEYKNWLINNYNYQFKPETLQKDTIENRLNKEHESLSNAKVVSKIKDKKDFQYYNAFGNKPRELDENEKQYKFVEKASLSPSQLNSYNYLLKQYEKNKPKNVSIKKEDLEFAVMLEAIANKYKLTFRSGVYQLALKQYDRVSLFENDIDEQSLSRMAFGNQCEEVILNHYAALKPDKNIKVDKATLQSNTFNVNFDIDGYIGNDLNNIDQVIEIKNSASPWYFDNPMRIVDSYKTQMIYYNELLHPRNGVKMIASLSQGKTTKLYEYDFLPSNEEREEFYDLLDLSKEAFDYMIKENIGNFNEKVNQIKQEIIDKLATKPYSPDGSNQP